MRLRRAVFVVLAVTAAWLVAACGPSSGQIQRAKQARYKTDANVVFKAAADAVSAKYKIKQADVTHGVLYTEARWYEKDGTFEDKAADGEQVMAEDGSILLAFEVRVIEETGTYQVEVVAHAAQIRAGYAAPYEFKPDDPQLPGWITGKLDDLYVTIHASLAQYDTAAAPS